MRHIIWIMALSVLLALLPATAWADEELYLPLTQMQPSVHIDEQPDHGDGRYDDVDFGTPWQSEGYVPLRCPVGEGVLVSWGVRGELVLKADYIFRHDTATRDFVYRPRSRIVAGALDRDYDFDNCTPPYRDDDPNTPDEDRCEPPDQYMFFHSGGSWLPHFKFRKMYWWMQRTVEWDPAIHPWPESEHDKGVRMQSIRCVEGE